MYRQSAAKTDLLLRHFSDATLPRLVHTFASFPSLPRLAWLQSFFTQFETGNLRALEIKHGYSNKQGLIPC